MPPLPARAAHAQGCEGQREEKPEEALETPNPFGPAGLKNLEEKTDNCPGGESGQLPYCLLPLSEVIFPYSTGINNLKFQI